MDYVSDGIEDCNGSEDETGMDDHDDGDHDDHGDHGDPTTITHSTAQMTVKLTLNQWEKCAGGESGMSNGLVCIDVDGSCNDGTTIGDITQAMMMDMTNRIMTDPHSFVVTV